MKLKYGVGYLGDYDPLKDYYTLRSRWESMIQRCYSPTHMCYHNYGGKGVTVDERWHSYANFLEDISKKEHYLDLLKEPSKWAIDKDKNGGLIYSNETCRIITSLENHHLASFKKVCQYSKQGEFISEFNSITEASEKTGVSRSGISSCCSGRLKTSGGFIWRYSNV